MSGVLDSVEWKRRRRSVADGVMAGKPVAGKPVAGKPVASCEKVFCFVMKPWAPKHATLGWYT